MYASCFALFVALFFIACGNEAAPAEAATTDPAPGAPTTAPARATTLPPLPVEEIQRLYDKVDYIDYLFTSLPISMSQQTPNDVKGAVTHISGDAPQSLDPSCTVLAQIFYEADGKTLRRADMYYGPTCTYLVWNENGKPTYASRLTAEGVQFFTSVLKNVRTE